MAVTHRAGDAAAADSVRRAGAGGASNADVEVITAVPLTLAQERAIEINLIKMLKKRVSLTLTVDPSLLGGVRIIANDMVVDDSIKRKLFDMKASITKEVFQAE